MFLDDQQLPAQHHPVEPEPGVGGGVDLVADPSVTVWAHQLRPTNVADFLTWTDGLLFFANGGPVVLLAGQVAGLGDWAVRDGAGRFEVVAGGEMSNRYQTA